MKAASRGVGGGGLAGQSGHLSRLLPTIPFSSGVLASESSLLLVFGL